MGTYSRTEASKFKPRRQPRRLHATTAQLGLNAMFYGEPVKASRSLLCHLKRN